MKYRLVIARRSSTVGNLQASSSFCPPRPCVSAFSFSLFLFSFVLPFAPFLGFTLLRPVSALINLLLMFVIDFWSVCDRKMFYFYLMQVNDFSSTNELRDLPVPSRHCSTFSLCLVNVHRPSWTFQPSRCVFYCPTSPRTPLDVCPPLPSPPFTPSALRPTTSLIRSTSSASLVPISYLPLWLLPLLLVILLFFLLH